MEITWDSIVHAQGHFLKLWVWEEKSPPTNTIKSVVSLVHKVYLIKNPHGWEMLCLFFRKTSSLHLQGLHFVKLLLDHSENLLISSGAESLFANTETTLLWAWRTLLVYTAKNLTSFGSYELIKTQIASIFGKKLKFINSFSLNIFFWL